MTSEATATSEKLSDPSRSTTDAPTSAPRFRVADYALLLKPRVMSLVVFTGVVG
ncbi:MAG: hypothetical protein HYS64_02145, partial [Rhodospirillales bacterium]|nr:hypothetical protein [Rhodospirillales bacterium]